MYLRRVDAVVRSNVVMVDSNTKGSSRSTLTLEAVVYNYLGFCDITEHDALDVAQWIKPIHIV